jgi:hypothetical protein
MTQFDVAYPATTPPPVASPGMVTHSLFDTSMYAGSALQRRYLAAPDDEQRMNALRQMPDATVTFYELKEGEEFFDVA